MPSATSSNRSSFCNAILRRLLSVKTLDDNFYFLLIAPLLKVDQTELLNVLKIVLSGVDKSNQFLKQNMPHLNEVSN